MRQRGRLFITVTERVSKNTPSLFYSVSFVTEVTNRSPFTEEDRVDPTAETGGPPTHRVLGNRKVPGKCR